MMWTGFMHSKSLFTYILKSNEMIPGTTLCLPHRIPTPRLGVTSAKTHWRLRGGQHTSSNPFISRLPYTCDDLGGTDLSGRIFSDRGAASR